MQNVGNTDPCPRRFNNAPENYTCPFCLLSAGQEDALVCSCQSDIIHADEKIMVFICAQQWPNNRGHVLIIPRQHFENIYDLPDDLGGAIHAMARRIAIAMKRAYSSDGITTRQHNEMHGNQEVWHYHLHVFPRFEGDGLYETARGRIMPAAERASYADLLRCFLEL